MALPLGVRRFMSAVDATAGLGAAFLRAGGGPKARTASVLATPAGQRHALAVLRFARPRLALSQNLVRCYDANSTLLLTRAADVAEVIAREEEFQVVYGPRMRLLTGGRDFFLGMQDGPDYRRDTAAMAAIVQPNDLDRVLTMARAEAAAALEGAAEIDLPPALSARIPALVVQRWFGVPMETDLLIADATAMFHYLFSDLAAEPPVTERALGAAGRVNAAIDAAAAAAGPDTLLGRAVAAGAAGEPAFDAAGVRANMLGIVIGAIPTLSKAAVLAVQELLRRPAMLEAARAAARAGDEDVVAAHLWEALRFSPLNPILYRRAAHATVIGATTVAKGTMVLASNLAAMFDEAPWPDAADFRPGRPWAMYQLWGTGLHRCWGDRINRALLPAMLTPLLARPRLAELAPPDGAGTPFPRHWRLLLH